ncbi:putative allophanate hydrolase [Agrobacterium rubi TR3 = NBRC 13261]|uniref:Putative allophanate hydrolase n=1 Tax=Agrobacterium rubi TR3 = NBRC 13261 TaxID=1368415 RepID=A0A081CZA5_9HYPH|nr:allophanate hydrolase [Agrobacterium rubi]MBP1880319.1 allophanate hydrolase [Agrobacterium rubi]GAK72001.1 putative allophanate hydrolase [Agrobacterium rubi TR3 = NBRC 13261]
MRTTPALDITSLHSFYQQGGRISEIIEAVFAHISEVNDPGIFIHLADKKALLVEAEKLGAYDKSKPLFGVPFAVKDNIDVAGMPTTAGCPDYTFLPEKDATVVRLLKDAGAIVIGKTNLDQFATGLVGVRSPYPIPKNAIDPTLIPGGSSSGSAVATAHGIVSFALGTDTAGSGRVPAGLNNIVGLKPSVGALSSTGVVPACRTLDCVSIFSLTVDDAWRVFSVAAQHDESDAYSKSVAANGYGSAPPVLKIGVPTRQDLQFFGDEAMASSYSDALKTLEGLGHQLIELPFADFYDVANLLYEGAWVAERYAAVQEFLDTKEDSFHPVTRHIYKGAKSLTAAETFNGLYALQALKKKLAPVIASIDLFCVPTAPRHYTLAELEAEPIRENSRLGTYTNFVNLLDMCGIAVPTGTREDGLPASVTLLAPSGKDGLTATLARVLHQASGLSLGATGWPQPTAAPEPVIEAISDLIDLVVVGAHLSGMPLNPQLKDLNAIFSRKAKTQDCYRLYALSGTTPPKPGMLRVDGGSGGEIDIEVWKLSPSAFGLFVSAIPAPLGIGTITLSDGTSAKGFLVEPVALKGALDITDYGGWRAYCSGADMKTATA